jgi:hypothetical protein
MDRADRDKLYEWLENGRVDMWLRRLMKERLAELEAEIQTSEDLDGIKREVLDYSPAETRHGGAAEALGFLASRADEARG